MAIERPEYLHPETLEWASVTTGEAARLCRETIVGEPTLYDRGQIAAGESLACRLSVEAVVARARKVPHAFVDANWAGSKDCAMCALPEDHKVHAGGGSR
jgi:hypothetical protein